MASRPLIKGSLTLLNIAGVNPNKSNVWTSLRAALCITSLSAVCVDLLLECYYDWKGLNSMDGLGVFIGVYQVAVKIVVMTAKRKEFLRIFKNMESFWPTDRYGTKLKNELEKSGDAILKYINVGLSISFVTETFYFLKPFFSDVKSLPFDTYHPTDLNKSPDYELAYVTLFIIVVVNTPGMLAFDVLFISMIINITWELKIIKQGLANIPINMHTSETDSESFRELTDLVEHHNLVMKCIKDIDKIYFGFLLSLFLSDMLSICTGLLCIVASGFPPTYDTLTKYGLFVIMFGSELFFYCLGGSHLISESEGVSNAIYESKWWIKTQPKLRKAYVLVIQRANKMEKLTAGGMFTLNLESFTSMVKTALSFFTLIHAVYKDTSKT